MWIRGIFFFLSFAAFLCLSMEGTRGGGVKGAPVGARVERYLNIRASMGPSLSPDGKSLAFLTNITGVNQVWGLQSPGSWPSQLTFFQDRVEFVQWAPSGKSLIFGMDTKGDERDQLYLLSLSGSGVSQGAWEVTPLTSNPKAIHHFGGWSRSGKKIAFSSNARNEAFFDLYVMELPEKGEEGSGSARLVYQDDSFNDPMAFSPDEKFLLFRRSYSSMNQDLFLLDLSSGQATLLTPHEGDVRYEQGYFSPNGKVIYLLTDDGEDYLEIAAMELSSKKLRRGLVREPWDVELLVVTEDGKKMGYVVNQDGYSRLVLRSLPSLKEMPVPSTPRGVITELVASRNGQLFAFTLTGAARPYDVWSYSPVTRKLLQMTRSSLAGLPRTSFVEPGLAKYKSFDGREIPAFLYLPRMGESSGGAAPQGAGSPVILYLHGGPESQERPDFAPLFQYFLSRGYAVFAPNIRGSTGYGKGYTRLDNKERRKDALQDLAYAGEHLKSVRGIDPGKIVVLGASYGGYMTLAGLTFYPDLWAAGVDIVGISNLETFLQNTGPWRRPLRMAEYGDLEKDRELLREISPLNHVEKIKAPLMVIQGANDPRVPQSEAEQMVKALKDRNLPVEYLLFEDEGHGLTRLPNRIKAYTAVVQFLDRVLGGSPARQ